MAPISSYELANQYFRTLSAARQKEVTEITEEIAAQLRAELEAQPDMTLRQQMGEQAMDRLSDAKLYLCEAQMQLQLQGYTEAELKGKDFKKLPTKMVLPVDFSVMERFPSVDQLGKYSVLDIQAAERTMRIKAALQTRNPEVADYVNKLWISKEGNQLQEQLVHQSKKHRLLTCAAKNCSGDTRNLLLAAAQSLRSSQPVLNHTMFLDGLEYAAGMRLSNVPQEIKEFFEHQMHAPLQDDLLQKAWMEAPLPKKFIVEFENLEHRLTQIPMANPKNWGKPLTEAEPISDGVMDHIVDAYARGTTDRLLDFLFSNDALGSDGKLTRGDLIIIDGKTVRERIQERYTNSKGDPAQFNDYYKEHHKELTNGLVAAGLMADQRVEIFVPKHGKISETSVPITRTGYEPSPLHPVALNAWQRFWSRFGFFKEKVKQVTEYQRMASARERVITSAREQNLLQEKPAINNSQPQKATQAKIAKPLDDRIL